MAGGRRGAGATARKTDNEQARASTALAALSGAERVDAYLEIFCTGEAASRASRIVTKAIRDRHPDLCRAPARRAATASARCSSGASAVVCRDRTAALLTIAARGASRAIAAEKERRGLLDYDDLIDKTLALLEHVDAAWVHYKLDLGIDHVLIDEAQDTSPKQWEIVERWSPNSPPARARATVKRTIFAVGDEKQSIFSFQGAAPQRVRRDAAAFRARAIATAALDFVAARVQAFVPLRRRSCSAPSTKCSSAAGHSRA